MFNLSIPVVALGISVLALIYAVVLIVLVTKRSTGSPKMQSIAKAIQEGAMAYLNRQTMTIAFFTIIIFLF